MEEDKIRTMFCGHKKSSQTKIRLLSAFTLHERSANKLSLDTSRTVAACELVNFVFRNHVVVSDD